MTSSSDLHAFCIKKRYVYSISTDVSVSHVTGVAYAFKGTFKYKHLDDMAAYIHNFFLHQNAIIVSTT